MDPVKRNSKLALGGIIGTIVYAVADLFLYLGTDIASDSKLSLWQVPEWRLMTSRKPAVAFRIHKPC